MKTKIQFIFLFFSLSYNYSKAQSNLQFNRVITFSGYVPFATNVTIDSVPSGKVWKIESYGLSPLISNRQACLNTFFAINGVEVMNYSNSYNSGYAIHPPTNQYWLKAGDVIGYKFITGGGTSGCTANQPYVISIIEYNIIP